MMEGRPVNVRRAIRWPPLDSLQQQVRPQEEGPELLGGIAITDGVGPTCGWGTKGLTLLIGVNGIGLSMILAGWFGAGDTAVVQRQIPWINLAIAGLALSAVNNGVWILRGRRSLVMMASRFPDRMINGRRSRIIAGDRADTGPVDWYVAGPLMTLYHRPNCPFVAGKSVQGENRAAHVTAGRGPCAVCEP